MSRRFESPHVVLPTEEDIDERREIDVQRSKWTKFLESRNHCLTEQWLWQYWREDSRPKNQFLKKATSFFSSKIQAQKKLKQLMRGGIPPEWRGRVWWACSGAEEKMKSASPEDQFGSLVQRCDELNGTIVKLDIEKDLRRTFPGHPFTESEDGLRSLRKVLSSYALRNPNIGYCQSMNFICALILFHMSEERAFWVFAALIEDILPSDYYSPQMIGGRVDQLVFQSCLAWKIPHVQAALKSSNTGLEPVIAPWILCLFINTLPLYTVCRLWDCLFWEGNIIIFRAALACMKLRSEEICSNPETFSIYEALRSGHAQRGGTFNLNSLPSSGCSRSSLLFEAAFESLFMKSMPRKRIEVLRVRMRALIEEQDRNTLIRREAVLQAKEDRKAKAAEAEAEDDSKTSSEGTEGTEGSMNYEAMVRTRHSIIR